ncbi:PREDICTED: protein-glutamine gamma-glutamyltransferase 5-like isoform X1 [Nanorana parkeri]|uniref:protein-glutamine gamma-glutamyltransferase 5-like isoform X1 n=1 Tax=Nanorana parkeri TaxID=125878 RepID=UPI000854FF61|nr:PREDICTED: protein-glutamine gamma-glutamyltransferase 5-like isoform X1 [Nanorana parkeri]
MAYSTAGPQLSRIDVNKLKNGQEHQTQGIRSKELTLRRGQPFNIKVLFYYNGKEEKLDSLKLRAETGSYPSLQSGTLIQFPVTKINSNKTWSAELESEGVNSLSINICSSATACVGRYRLYLEGTYWKTPTSYYLGDLILLFNPWCPDDDVFLDNEALRQEYVINEHGMLYQGTKDFIVSTPWNFGQFEDGVGEICLRILDMSPNFLKDPAKDCSKRGDPVYISRVISAMINSNDDRGVLESCWDELFRNGVNPSSWSGSVNILRLWDRSGCRPVRYGQCWVLAGVMCTVMRFLGIPTRIVTNFESAHDTNFTLTVDEFYDENGKKLDPAQGDSVWNFHVWNECWMARKDLRPGYDGWQVLDATPQEISGGTYCCGPAPVKAIKEGDMDVDYDIPFVFAEVNGDIVHWVLRDGGAEKAQIDTYSIGKYISTKGVGSNTREDITSEYKYTEGSSQERAVFEKAVANIKTKKPFRERDSFVALDFDVSIKLAESPLIGQTVLLIFRIHNRSYEAKRFAISISAQEMVYNGKALDEFWGEQFELDVNANRDFEKGFQLHPFHYERYVRSGNNFRVTALATDLESKKLKLASKNIIFEVPSVDIKMYGTPQLNQSLNVILSFSNPFNEVLSNCVMTAEGAGLFPGGPITVHMDQIFPRRVGFVRIYCVPFKRGNLQLEASFSCNKIRYVKGSEMVNVPWM